MSELVRQQIPKPVDGVLDVASGCGCGLEIDGEGNFWINHETKCPALELVRFRSVLLMHFGAEMGEVNKTTTLDLLKRLVEEHRKFHCALSRRQRARLGLSPLLLFNCGDGGSLPRAWHDFLPDSEIVEMLATMSDADIQRFLEERKTKLAQRGNDARP